MKLNLKFGRKSSDADASDADGKSSAKTSSRKSRNDKESFRTLFLNHVEKVLLGVALLLAGYMVFAGYQARSTTRGMRPEQLTNKVRDAKQVLLKDTWRNVEAYLTPKLELGARARQTLQKMPDSAYAIRHPVSPPVLPEDRKRGDPILLPVEQLEVHTGYGALSLQANMDGEEEDARTRIRRTAIDTGEERRALPDAEKRFPGLSRGRRGGELKSTYFACVTGLVPYKQQWEAYRDAFLNAGGMEPSRDTPRYIYFYVERAEVLPTGQLSSWTRLKPSLKEEARWGRKMRPVSDPTYLDPSLTRPIPPVIMRDLSDISRHSKVPSYEESLRNRRTRRRTDKTAGEDQADGAEEEEGPDTLSDLAPLGGRGMMRGGGYEDEMGGGRFEEGRDGGSRYEDERGYYDEGGGERMGMGMGMGRGMEVAEEDIPEWKMFRFYDFSVEPGKTYVYRVQLLLEDPNNPDLRMHQPPSARYLDRSVSDRIALLPKPNPGRRRTYWRATDWSEPSSAVVTATGREVLIGEAKPTEMRSLVDPNTRQKIRFPKTGGGPSAMVLAKAWDPERHTDVAVPVEVFRGSWPMVTDDLWVVDTDQGNASLVKVPQYTLSADSLVLDIRGGTPLEDAPWTAPAECLVMDAQGNLILHDEMADQDNYARWDFPPDPRDAAMDRREMGRPTMEDGLYRRPGGRSPRGTRRSR